MRGWTFVNHCIFLARLPGPSLLHREDYGMIRLAGNNANIAIEVACMLGMYGEATETFVDFNDRHPEFGDYGLLHTSPLLDRAK